MLLPLANTYEIASFLSFAIAFNFSFSFFVTVQTHTGRVSDAHNFVLCTLEMRCFGINNIVVHNDGNWGELMSSFLTVETNSTWKCIYCPNRIHWAERRWWNAHQPMELMCDHNKNLLHSATECWIMFLCSELHSRMPEMLWILIHRPFLRALRIKIHACRLRGTNIYTLLICPFYSWGGARASSSSASPRGISHIAK